MKYLSILKIDLKFPFLSIKMDDVVFSRFLLSCDDYSTFNKLSLTCKKIYKVSNLVRKEWIKKWFGSEDWKNFCLKKFPNLCNFVYKHDLKYFFDLLLKIESGKLKDECSVLLVSGFGKTTFTNFIKRMEKDCGKSSKLVDVENGVGNSEYLNKYVLLENEDYIFDIKELHEKINEGFYMRSLYEGKKFIERPGTIILSDYLVTRSEIKDSYVRKPFYLNLNILINPIFKREYLSYVLDKEFSSMIKCLKIEFKNTNYKYK